ncbi:MAG: hypothetical protein J0I49_33180 [Pseudonocardia sp.]|uniref:hypothetical protein n=1 Tax=Pseudonocardia sp. TaxID=60912 RepID=UPI001AC36843|nr:hypothetical protein [Pseudonocardia sp.]MBN9102911.1 hypothetical protein [Pseudonocardia sp.]
MDENTNVTPITKAPAPGSAGAGPVSVGAGRGPRVADDQVRAIAKAVDRNARKTTELNEQVRRLADDVARLVTLVTTPPLIPAPTSARIPGDAADARPARAGGPPERDPTAPDSDEDVASPESGEAEVRSWLLISDPEQAVTVLADLVEWLDRVYLRFPNSELGACWLWHPHVIEELLWLRCAHSDAYSPETGSWLRAGDWHDRQRPGVVRRVREALGKCDLSLHEPGRPHGHAPVVAPLVAHAAQIAEQWATTSTRPEPTPAQLTEAADYATALHRRTR